MIPLGVFAEQAPPRLGESRRAVIVYCHHGIRSMRAVNWLRARGFHHSFSLRGGIERWALEVDPSLARY